MSYTHEHHWGPWRETAITAGTVTVTRDCTCGDSQFEQVRPVWADWSEEDGYMNRIVDEGPTETN